jgi:subtilisin family serine protease
MLRTFTVAVVTLAASAIAITPASSASAPAAGKAGAPGVISYADDARAVEGSYIAVLHEDTPSDETDKIADELTAKSKAKKALVYTAALQGFSFQGSEDSALEISRDNRVAYVAQDIEITTDALGVQVGPPSWGLDRIDQRSLPLDNKYHFPNTATNVVAYIIDTGILLTHQEFGGRAFCGFDPWAMGCAPCNQGHGTHVAGTVGGSRVGVAKGVRIVSVRVFECSSGTTAAIVIAGVNYVTFAASISPNTRAVANMSLGGGAFAPLDTAVTNSIAANVHYSVAAGNSNADACLFSPARVPRATTVGATANNDSRATFSNFGTCVDLFAPGVNIVSAWYTANNAYTTLSGTSMASPHAAGTAAMWRQKFPADNADQTATALAANATPGVVVNPGLGSPNLLLFMGMIPV